MVPIVIHNAGDVAPKGDFVFRPATVEVDVLPPLDTSAWSADTIDEHVAEVRRLFQATLGQEREQAALPVVAEREPVAEPAATRPGVKPATAAQAPPAKASQKKAPKKKAPQKKAPQKKGPQKKALKKKARIRKTSQAGPAPKKKAAQRKAPRKKPLRKKVLAAKSVRDEAGA
jgi:putative phosphoserine phosphatase/1-acylglycerol-3-phosphate O-acyltransferase